MAEAPLDRVSTFIKNWSPHIVSAASLLVSLFAVWVAYGDSSARAAEARADKHTLAVIEAFRADRQLAMAGERLAQLEVAYRTFAEASVVPQVRENVADMLVVLTKMQGRQRSSQEAVREAFRELDSLGEDATATQLETLRRGLLTQAEVAADLVTFADATVSRIEQLSAGNKEIARSLEELELQLDNERLKEGNALRPIE